MPHDLDPDIPGEPQGERLAPGVIVPAACLRFAFSRSGGPGGQNVNKVETKAELRVALADIPVSPGVAHRLVALAGRRVVAAEHGPELVLVSQSERSQSANRRACVERLAQLVLEALVEPKVRRKTKPSRSSVRRRLESKKIRGQVKRSRRKEGE